MGKVSMSGYKYTSNIADAVAFIERFRGASEVNFEITVHGAASPFYYDKPVAIVYIGSLICYKLNFASGVFAYCTPRECHFYLAHWEQVALYQYLHSLPTVPAAWPEAERKIRSRRGDPLKMLRDALENHSTVKIEFGAAL